MEKCNVMFIFVPDACRQIFVSFLHFLVKHSALQLPCYLFSSLWRLFWNIGEFVGKKYFTDHGTANAIQLIVAIKGGFSSQFFY